MPPFVFFTAVNQTQRSSLKGTLHLVDLAGSERLSRSNATGDRLKETVAINKSLSSLTDVFVSISNKSSHVSFFFHLFVQRCKALFYFLFGGGGRDIFNIFRMYYTYTTYGV